MATLDSINRLLTGSTKAAVGQQLNATKAAQSAVQTVQNAGTPQSTNPVQQMTAKGATQQVKQPVVQQVSPQAVPTQPAPVYQEQKPTNYGGEGNPLNEILFAKKQYDAGNTGWASAQAANYYKQLSPEEAKAVQGMNTQQLIDYINKKQDPYGVQDFMKTLGLGADGMKDSINDLANAGFDGQMAALEADKNAKIAEIQKAYNQAVADGEMSVRDAQAAYQQEVDSINQQAYQDAQNTNVQAAGRGIANSQQVLGMMASDNARANTNRNNSAIARDRTLADIKQRLNTLSLNKDLDVANVGMQYDMSKAQYAAQRDQMIAQMNFEIQKGDHEAATQLAMNLKQMDAQYGYDVKMLDNQTAAQSQLMKEQLGIDKELQGYINELDLQKMAKQYGYDLGKMKASYGYEKLINDANHAFQASESAKDRSFTASQNAADRAQSAANSRRAAAASGDNYAQSVQRELAKYTPGTPEYKIMQGQLAYEKTQSDNEMLRNVQNDVVMKKALENNNIDVSQYSSFDALAAAVNQKTTTTSGKPNPNVKNGLTSLWDNFKSNFGK